MSKPLTPFREIPARAWMILGLGTFAATISLMPSTQVNVALPAITATLGMEPSHGQWISTIWLASTTVSMLMVDWMVSHFGYRNSMFVCLLTVLLASLICAGSGSSEMLLLGRAFQGLGAGPIPSLVMLAIFEIFPMDRRGFAGGVMASGVILAPTFGPVMAGWFVTNLNWHWSFLALVPFILLSMPLILRYFPDSKGVSVKRRLDWVSLLLLIVFLGTFMYAMTYGPTLGWRDTRIAVCFWLALFALIFFIHMQVYGKQPLIKAEIFKNSQFTVACILTAVLGLALYGTSFFIPLLVQNHQGMEPMQSGLLFVPAGLLMSLVFPLGGYLTDRFDARYILIPGLLIMIYSLLMLTNIGNETSTTTIIVAIIVSRIGMGLIMPSLTVAAMSPLPPPLLTQASGMSNFTRQIGGGLGINFLAVYWMQMSVNRSDWDSDAVHWGNDMAFYAYDFGAFINWVRGYSWPTAETLSQVMLQGTMKQWSMIWGYRDIFEFLIWIMAICLILAFFISPRYKYEMGPASSMKPSSPTTDTSVTLSATKPGSSVSG